MKIVSRVLMIASILSLSAAPLAFAAVEKTVNPGAVPQMLFYEAAEQAAEESYAVIIPSTDNKQKDNDEAASKDGQPKDAAADDKAGEKAPQKAE